MYHPLYLSHPSCFPLPVIHPPMTAFGCKCGSSSMDGASSHQDRNHPIQSFLFFVLVSFFLSFPLSWVQIQDICVFLRYQGGTEISNALFHFSLPSPIDMSSFLSHLLRLKANKRIPFLQFSVAVTSFSQKWWPLKSLVGVEVYKVQTCGKCLWKKWTIRI